MGKDEDVCVLRGDLARNALVSLSGEEEGEAREQIRIPTGSLLRVTLRCPSGGVPHPFAAIFPRKTSESPGAPAIGYLTSAAHSFTRGAGIGIGYCGAREVAREVARAASLAKEGEKEEMKGGRVGRDRGKLGRTRGSGVATEAVELPCLFRNPSSSHARQGTLSIEV